MARHVSLSFAFAFLFVVPAIEVICAAAEPSQTSTLEAVLNLAKEFESFRQQLHAIEARLASLQTANKQKSTTNSNRCAARSIVKAIRTSSYLTAVEEFNDLKSNDVIPKIVHDAYAGSSGNTDSVLNFARFLKNAETKILVFSALRDEMLANCHKDPFKLITLGNELQTTFSKLDTAESKVSAQAAIDGTAEDVKTTAAGIFKSAMVANNFRNNPQVEALASALFEFRPDVFTAVIESVVEIVSHEVTAETIINNFAHLKHSQQIIAGLTAVFKRSHKTGQMQNHVIYELASNLQQLQAREDYENLDQSLKDDVDSLVHQLPGCVSILVFPKKVCLWNRGRNMFLYAAGDSTPDKNRRSIQMHPDDSKPGAAWIVEKNGTEQFLIRNVDYKNEYLYASQTTHDNDFRNVFTWTPGDNIDGQSLWSVDPVKNYCYLKSTHFNEYLCAPSLKEDNVNANAFTSITGKGGLKSEDVHWQLRNCGNSEV